MAASRRYISALGKRRVLCNVIGVSKFKEHEWQPQRSLPIKTQSSPKYSSPRLRPASSRRSAIPRNFPSGGDKRVSITSLSPPWTSAPAASGAVTASAPTAKLSTSRANISKSIRLAFSSTPGSAVTIRPRRLFAGSSSRTPFTDCIQAAPRNPAPARLCEFARKDLPATLRLQPTMAKAGSASWAGSKPTWKGTLDRVRSQSTRVSIQYRDGYPILVFRVLCEKQGGYFDFVDRAEPNAQL